jgi:hypothetical protein
VNVTVNGDSLQLERLLKIRNCVGRCCLQIFAQNIELSQSVLWSIYMLVDLKDLVSSGGGWPSLTVCPTQAAVTVSRTLQYSK